MNRPLVFGCASPGLPANRRFFSFPKSCVSCVNSKVHSLGLLRFKTPNLPFLKISDMLKNEDLWSLFSF